MTDRELIEALRQFFPGVEIQAYTQSGKLVPIDKVRLPREKPRQEKLQWK